MERSEWMLRILEVHSSNLVIWELPKIVICLLLIKNKKKDQILILKLFVRCLTKVNYNDRSFIKRNVFVDSIKLGFIY